MKHGGDLSGAIAQYGGALQDWLDLSTGINPQSWPVKESLLAQALNRLPARRDEEALISAARDFYKVPDDTAIVAAPGTQALIQWLPYLAPEGEIGIFSPTYSEHALSWKHAGRPASHLAIDTKTLPPHVRHAVLVNPNNPDGYRSDRKKLIQLAETMRGRDGWLIVDEAFADCEPAISSIELCAEFPVIVLRSFGKFFGLPGLRLGFLIAAPKMAGQFQAALGPWPVSAPALLIGAEALSDQAWADTTREKLVTMSKRLDLLLLEAAGFSIVGGTPLFRFAQHPNASVIHKLLARQHIWCRCFDEFPNHLRFGLPRDTAELSRLALALGAPASLCNERS